MSHLLKIALFNTTELTQIKILKILLQVKVIELLMKHQKNRGK